MRAGRTTNLDVSISHVWGLINRIFVQVMPRRPFSEQRLAALARRVNRVTRELALKSVPPELAAMALKPVVGSGNGESASVGAGHAVAILERANESFVRTLLLGPAGSGKSTLLLSLLAEIVRVDVGEVTRVGVFVRTSDWSGSRQSFADRFAEIMWRHYGVSIDALYELLGGFRVTLCVDGLDEFGGDPREFLEGMDLLIRKHEVACILCCRTDFFEREKSLRRVYAPLATFVTQPLGESAIREFLRGKAAGGVDLENIVFSDYKLRKACRLPIHLAHLVRISGQGKSIPRDTPSLLESYIRECVAHVTPDAFQAERLYEFLESVALADSGGLNVSFSTAREGWPRTLISGARERLARRDKMRRQRAKAHTFRDRLSRRLAGMYAQIKYRHLLKRALHGVGAYGCALGLACVVAFASLKISETAALRGVMGPVGRHKVMVIFWAFALCGLLPSPGRQSHPIDMVLPLLVLPGALGILTALAFGVGGLIADDWRSFAVAIVGLLAVVVPMDLRWQRKLYESIRRAAQDRSRLVDERDLSEGVASAIQREQQTVNVWKRRRWDPDLVVRRRDGLWLVNSTQGSSSFWVHEVHWIPYPRVGVRRVLPAAISYTALLLFVRFVAPMGSVHTRLATTFIGGAVFGLVWTSRELGLCLYWFVAMRATGLWPRGGNATLRKLERQGLLRSSVATRHFYFAHEMYRRVLVRNREGGYVAERDDPRELLVLSGLGEPEGWGE